MFSDSVADHNSEYGIFSYASHSTLDGVTASSNGGDGFFISHPLDLPGSSLYTVRNSTADRNQCSARSGSPIASSMSSARLGAPPCRGPESAPIAPQIEAARSASVEVITRAVNVEALNP